MRDSFIRALSELTATDPRIYTLVADNGAIVFDNYRALHPDHFINCGVAEATMISAAAGMASTGLIPFTYTISNFIAERAFEQIRDDVCYQRMNVKIVGVGSGITYANLGPTHHGIEDIALMRMLPGMTVFSPADPRETFQATKAMAQIQGPCYMRIAGRGEPSVHEGDFDFTPGKGIVLREGGSVTIVATGVLVADALEAAILLEEKGIHARVINIHTLAPFDSEIIIRSARDIGAILTVEEHNVIGGLGSAVAETLARLDCRTRGLCDDNDEILPAPAFASLGLTGFCEDYDTHNALKAQLGLDAAGIAKAAERLYWSKKS
ncbi:MAG: transketolase [Candidatus Sumerlaeota bacterium]|nr:transketolase [Candidatus Sumerlaeota bacterium]